MSTIKNYSTYSQMMSDQNPGDFAFITSTGARFQRINNQWVSGFVNQFNPIDYQDYTAWDVWPTSIGYAQNSTISNVTYYSDNSSVDYLNGRTVHRELAAGSIEMFNLRSYSNQNDIDIIVDWGDGTLTNVNTITPSTSNGNHELTEYTYSLSHTYTVTDKVFTVKVYGKKYFNINRGSNVNTAGILCNCFNDRLPIASHLNNLASFACRTTKLFSVHFSEYIQNLHISSMSHLFFCCYNLEEVIGITRICSNLYNVGRVFCACTNLEYTDFIIPSLMIGKSTNTNAMYQLFDYCQKLNVDIIKLLPYIKFTANTISADKMFNNCELITCSDYTKLGKYLWNNTDVTWTNTSTAFSGCSSALRANVPQSWGGTASDDIIVKQPPIVMSDVTVSDGLWNEIENVQGGKRYLVKVDANGDALINNSGVGTLVIDAVEMSASESQIWVYFDPNEQIETQFPETLGWLQEPNFEAGKYYIINIRHNKAIAKPYTVEVTK